MKYLMVLYGLLVLLLGLNSVSFAHCEIPCGIYGDERQFLNLAEDIITIEKSMKMIDELSGDVKNINQLVRWVKNKEIHSDHIRKVLIQYFMTQRVKVPGTGDQVPQLAYLEKLKVLHKMVVVAMKCKQTTNLENVKRLQDLMHEFKALYNGK